MQEMEKRPVPFGSAFGQKPGWDEIPRPVKELKGALRGIFGDLLKQTLDREQAVIANDRQFEIVKRQTMDASGAAERAAMAIVSRLLLQGDGNGTADAHDRTG
jgi:hypothetical protein